MNTAENEFLAFSKQVLGIEELTETDNFLELDLDSILMIKYINKLNKEYGQTLTIIDLFETASVKELYRKIGGQEQLEAINPIGIRFSNRIDPTTDYMFFLAPVTGEANCYAPIAANFLNNYNCIGLQYTEDHGVKPETVADFCKVYLNDIQGYEIDEARSITVVGYSMGAIIGYELIKELKHDNKQLVLIDGNPRIEENPPFDEEKSLELIHKFLYMNEVMSGTKNKQPKEERDAFANRIYHNLNIVNEHLHKEVVDNDILAIASTDNHEEMKKWAQYSSGNFELHEIPNTNHFNILDYTAEISEMIQNRMDKTKENEPV